MQLLKTGNKVWCFQLFGSPHGLWLLLPVPHGLVMFSLSPGPFWKSGSVFPAVSEVDLIHGGRSYTCARAAQKILNRSKLIHLHACVSHSFLLSCHSCICGNICSILKVKPCSLTCFLHGCCFFSAFCGQEGKNNENIVWTILNVQTMYKHLIYQKVQKLLFYFFYFSCMNSIEQQELKQALDAKYTKILPPFKFSLGCCISNVFQSPFCVTQR